MPHRVREISTVVFELLVCAALAGCMPEGVAPRSPVWSAADGGAAGADAVAAPQQPAPPPQPAAQPPQPTPQPSPQPAPAPQPATGDPCQAASFGDGYYCARSLDPASHAEELYGCAGQRTFSLVSCPSGCQVMPPGSDDACAVAASAPSPPPAAGDLCTLATLGDGDYCAASLDPASKSSNLYSCQGQRIAVVTACPDGCQQNPPGIDDVCASPPPPPPPPPSDPCADAALGDGDYCAESLDPASKAATLYTCIGKQTAAVVTCPAGCQVNAPGIDDVCATAAAPPIVPADLCSRAALGDGDYCAASLEPTSVAATLYSCVGHKTAKLVQCPAGCQVMPPGLNDVCAAPAVAPPACTADAAFACGGSSAWCYAGQCRLCTQGYFNCNGQYGCECSYGCFGLGCLQCRADAAFSCKGATSWCAQGQCRQCAAQMFNCDGRDGCECTGGCDGTKCKQRS